MKILVIKNTEAASCPKGILVKKYLAGEVYDIFDKLAQVFISEKWGEEVEEKAIKIKLENKAIESVPENKEIDFEKEEEVSQLKPKKKTK